MSQIPVIQVQHNFLEVINDVNLGHVKEESIWLRIDDKRYTIAISKSSFQCLENEQLQFKQLSSTSFQIIPSSNETITIEVPKSYFSSELNFDLQSHNITSIGAIAQDESCSIIIGGSDGSINKLDTTTSASNKLKPTLLIESAHYLDITNLEIFPSKKVLLTSSLDLLIKLWSLETGQNPRTFKGKHKQRITDLKLIGIGRNFVSSSLDGSCCVWECGFGECVWSARRVKDVNDPVLAIHVDEINSKKDGSTTTTSPDSKDEKFFDCNGKVLYAAHQSGTISIWDLETRCSLGEIDASETPIYSIDVHGDYIIVGSDKLVCFNKRTKELMWKKSIFSAGDSVLSLQISKIKNQGDLMYCLIPSKNQLFSVERSSGTLNRFFVGHDEQINDFTLTENQYIYVAGKRGLLMKYKV